MPKHQLVENAVEFLAKVFPGCVGPSDIKEETQITIGNILNSRSVNELIFVVENSPNSVSVRQ